VKHFTITPHTADVRLELEASTLEELFSVALIGMAEFIKLGACSKISHDIHEIQEEISITSIDTTVLLIDFLSDVLTKTHINKAIFCTITFSELTDTSIHAIIFGKYVESFDEDVKAITYHEANVKRNSSGNYTTVIVFDI